MTAYFPAFEWGSVLPALESLFGKQGEDVYLALMDLPEVEVLGCFEEDPQTTKDALHELIQGIKQAPSAISDERLLQCAIAVQQWEIKYAEQSRSSTLQKQRLGNAAVAGDGTPTTPSKCRQRRRDRTTSPTDSHQDSTTPLLQGHDHA
eukprot:TRINITY_DN7452_c0_g2_i2.p1 TRINITY_DN7452_c0_g2~~TRINITY_DN7452_c0_g2_i2.p1  ORF type:complete len:149 (+),score=11.55 TRINITY_DN7452_c0_g2_i2:232-678(+)